MPVTFSEWVKAVSSIQVARSSSLFNCSTGSFFRFVCLEGCIISLSYCCNKLLDLCGSMDKVSACRAEGLEFDLDQAQVSAGGFLD